MIDRYGEIPLFLESMNHQAFFRYERHTWPGEGYYWVVYCPGCEEMAISVKGTAAAAEDLALNHRVDHGAWIPPESNPWGPRKSWGPQLKSEMGPPQADRD
jgi:hypothetical protein